MDEKSCAMGCSAGGCRLNDDGSSRAVVGVCDKVVWSVLGYSGVGIKAGIGTPNQQPTLYDTGDGYRSFISSFANAINGDGAWIQTGWAINKSIGGSNGPCKSYVEIEDPGYGYYCRVFYGSTLGWNTSKTYEVVYSTNTGGMTWKAIIGGSTSQVYTFSSGGPWQVDVTSEMNQISNQCKSAFTSVKSKPSILLPYVAFDGTQELTGHFSMNPSNPYQFTTHANGL
jgi:hypothetical protein